MVLTSAQITAFFEYAAQMGLSNGTQFDSFNSEGITSVDELSKWEDNNWDQCMIK